MQRFSELLRSIGDVVTFDYDYMRAGRKAPDRLPQLVRRHREVVESARAAADQAARRLILIGKSMGSRVGCHVALQTQVDALICLGYPLRGAAPSAPLRDQVLLELERPVLFVQGTRDKLCPLDELNAVRTRMRAPSALYVVESGDHSLVCTQTFLRQHGRTQSEVHGAILEHIARFVSHPPVGESTRA